MLNQINYSPSFQKKLLAKTELKQAEEKVPCNFYLLDSVDDEDYIVKQSNTCEWYDSIYFSLIASDYADGKYYLSPNVSFYTMEDENGNCLAAIEELKHSDGYRNIELIEVAPIHSERNSYRQIKYIGETMVSFLASLIRKENPEEKLCVSFPADDVKFFWKKLGFEKRFGSSSELIISEENTNALLERNQQHNDSKIEFVG